MGDAHIPPSPWTSYIRSHCFFKDLVVCEVAAHNAATSFQYATKSSNVNSKSYKKSEMQRNLPCSTK